MKKYTPNKKSVPPNEKSIPPNEKSIPPNAKKYTPLNYGTNNYSTITYRGSTTLG